MIPIRCLTKNGYYINFDRLESALNIGMSKADIKHSIINKVSVAGLKWFLKNESDLKEFKKL